jgi:hypothetical protein
VKLFQCQNCAQALFFENSTCMGCRRPLGYVAEAQKLVLIPEAGEDPNASFLLPEAGPERYLRCRNYAEHAACNWLVVAPVSTDSATAEHAPYCRSCELTEVIPDLSDAANLNAWGEVERAKRRLLYTLQTLNLPLSPRSRDRDQGLAFQFLRGTKRQPVTTGHSAGVITLNVAETNAAFRENMREKLGEAYRTVLGHLRHEIGHYYWDRLIAGSDSLQGFRGLFGDERQDYQKAIERHYGAGPPGDWSESFISAYASMHPWEDWAETWAHYLHMQDTLETAKSHGLTVRVPGSSGARLATDDLAFRDFGSLAEGWHAVTVALNSLSRSMGLPDAYPFVLSQPVQGKLRFIHQLIHDRFAPKSVRGTAASSRVPAPPAE